MARRFTLESLFHDKDRVGMPAPYKNDDAVLDAVQARRKALSFSTTSLEWIAENGEEFVEMAASCVAPARAPFGGLPSFTPGVRRRLRARG